MNESTTEFDPIVYIGEILGPERALPLSWMLVLTSVYIVIFLMGTIGNILVVIVILKFRFMRENITNLYLCNLAVTDLLSITAGMPLELYQLWHQWPWALGQTACHLKSLIPETTACASVLTLVVLTVERFRAICVTPMSSSVQSSSCDTIHVRKVALRNIIIIWILSIVAATPLTVFTRINYLPDPKKEGTQLYDSAWCGLPFNAPNRVWENFMIMSTVAFFIIPLIVITLLYSLIGRTLKKANRIPNPDFNSTDRTKIMKSRTIVVRLLVAIVIAFTICWTPFHAQRLLFLYVSLYAQWTDELRHVNQILFLAAGVFYYLNSSVNPVLYSVMSTRFRAAFSLYVSEFCSNSSSSSDRAGSSRLGRPPTVIRAPKSISDHNSSHRSTGEGGGGGGTRKNHVTKEPPGIEVVSPPIVGGPVAVTVSPGDVHWSKNPNYFQS